MAGWREWVGLPALGITRIKAKLDTGARTSALHALSSERYSVGGAPFVRLRVQPRQREDGRVLVVETAVIDERFVTDSSGHRERRIVIASQLTVGGQSWPIELTVTNRDSLRFRMLLGRSAMQGRLVVDPDRSYLLGKPSKSDAAHRPRNRAP
ncbi:MAG: ATP-dependent zinc protease [Gammaproteobacteria bacterium]